MYRYWVWCAVLVLLKVTYGVEDQNEWAMEIESLDGRNVDDIARDIAEKYGMEIQMTISKEHMPEFVMMRRQTKHFSDNLLKVMITMEPEVKWVEKQFDDGMEIKYRQDWADLRNMKTKNSYMKDDMCRCHNNKASSDSSLSSYVFNAQNMKMNNSYLTHFNDYRFPCQVELFNCGQSYGPSGYDLDIANVWKKGFTGKGVTVSVVDDGVDFRQTDLKKNYNPNASFDFTEYPDLDGPLPFSWKSHGTECAGLIAMEANNGYCGVGIAYDVKFGAIRLMGKGHTTDAREAACLIYNANLIDIYSNSWGPTDNGWKYGKPKTLTRTAFERGTKYGRNGLGNIYTHASGNGGGTVNDCCGADGFTCMIETISVTSISPNGKPVFFTEPCSCVMVGVPQGDPDYKPLTKYGEVDYSKFHYLITTYPQKGCVNKFSGTSAATPVAAAGIALVLEANPNLSWRDVQYLIANTSRVTDPTDDKWQINGAGYNVHYHMGFGSMDVLRMVEFAQKWKTVDKQQTCDINVMTTPGKTASIPSGGRLIWYVNTNSCQGTDNQVLQLEHVKVVLSYNVKCRGDLKIRLTSPCGTRSNLMNPRKNDHYSELLDWPYMTVFNWGEDPRGMWTLEITDVKGHASSSGCMRSSDEINAGNVLKFKMIFYGVKADHKRHTTGCTGKANRLNRLRNAAKSVGHAYGKFISSLSEVNLIKSALDFQFIEEFKRSTIEKETSQIKTGSVPKKIKTSGSVSIAYQATAMSNWKAQYPSNFDQAKTLVDFAFMKKYPDEISKDDFDVVRCRIAKDLFQNPGESGEKFAALQNDYDGLVDDYGTLSKDYNQEYVHENTADSTKGRRDLSEDENKKPDEELIKMMLFGETEDFSGSNSLIQQQEIYQLLSRLLLSRNFDSPCSDETLEAMRLDS